jgi:hypothetical protein
VTLDVETDLIKNNLPSILHVSKNKAEAVDDTEMFLDLNKGHASVSGKITHLSGLVSSSGWHDLRVGATDNGYSIASNRLRDELDLDGALSGSITLAPAWMITHSWARNGDERVYNDDQKLVSYQPSGWKVPVTDLTKPLQHMEGGFYASHQKTFHTLTPAGIPDYSLQLDPAIAFFLDTAAPTSNNPQTPPNPQTPSPITATPSGTGQSNHTRGLPEYPGSRSIAIFNVSIMGSDQKPVANQTVDLKLTDDFSHVTTTTVKTDTDGKFTWNAPLWQYGNDIFMINLGSMGAFQSPYVVNSSQGTQDLQFTPVAK